MIPFFFFEEPLDSILRAFGNSDCVIAIQRAIHKYVTRRFIFQEILGSEYLVL